MLQALSQILFTQGFGTRRICQGLIEKGHVSIKGLVVTADEPVETEGLMINVQGQSWPVYEKAYIAMHKPLGFECSQRPRHHPSVYTLLPSPLRLRQVQSVGRLDHDTSGLLLFTDDGQWIHRLSSPKYHVPKVYKATTAREVSAEQIKALLSGVRLKDEIEMVKAQEARALDAHHIELVLTEGKYHQVRRMIAAVGNHVEQLVRTHIGALSLDNLPEGQWRWLKPEEQRQLALKPQKAIEAKTG